MFPNLMTPDQIDAALDGSSQPTTKPSAKPMPAQKPSAPAPQPVDTAKATANAFASELRNETIAIRLRMNTVTRSRKMAARQSGEIADHFGAKPGAVTGNKVLFAPKQKEIAAISSVLRKTRAAWMAFTFEYLTGVRLLRKQELAAWEEKFESLKVELAKALADAEANHDAIIDAAREELGPELFNADDYPYTFVDWIRITWCEHNFEPSDKLLRLAPVTYQREQERVRKQFDAVVELYEQTCRTELQKLVEALQSKLADATSGKKMKYTESATTNLREFFEEFERKSVKSDAELAAIIKDAKDALGDTTMADVKKSTTTRDALAESFGKVADQLGKLIIESPVRTISVDDLD